MIRVKAANMQIFVVTNPQLFIIGAGSLWFRRAEDALPDSLPVPAQTSQMVHWSKICVVLKWESWKLQDVEAKKSDSSKKKI